MSPSRIQIGVLCVALIAAIGAIEWQREGNAALRRELASKTEELERTRMDSARALAFAREKSRRPQGVRVSRGPQADPSLTASHEDEKPRLKLLMAQFRRRYARFVQDHGLTPDQGERLVQLLAERQLLDDETLAAARDRGLGGAAAHALLKEPDAAITQELNGLLSPEQMAALGPYEHASFVQSIYVDPMAAQDLDAGMPLTAAQVDKLTGLIIANTRGVPISPSFGNEASVDWEAVSAKADAILSPAQLALLQSSVPQLNLQQENNIQRLKAEHPD